MKNRNPEKLRHIRLKNFLLFSCFSPRNLLLLQLKPKYYYSQLKNGMKKLIVKRKNYAPCEGGNINSDYANSALQVFFTILLGMVSFFNFNGKNILKNSLCRGWMALLLSSPLFAHADAIDSLEAVLRDKPQIQEKIYLHLDNNCYFLGDTIWYKAYVVTADNLHPTNLSKLLYVELLNSDGFVVERQHVIVSDKGMTCGQFALSDSLYSGYYEIRAYTKWQLNFNVTHRKYSFVDERRFYNKQMCADFFREYPGLYSRVVPIYNKVSNGAYHQRYMSRRPKQHVLNNTHRLLVKFLPEGGNCVQGVDNAIAFEATDQDGQAMDVEGVLLDGTKVKTDYMGRGVFHYTPSDAQQKITFKWEGKDYSFKLPKAVKEGVALRYDPLARTATVSAVGVRAAAYAVLCRGRLQKFQRLNGEGTISLKDVQLPTGVNELVIYGTDANLLASRLFFINNHDMGGQIDVKMTANIGGVVENTTLSPYEKVNLTLTPNLSSLTSNHSPLTSNPSSPVTYSIAIRDARTDDPGYDDGNIMTDMLLSSELRGFVAYPAYYFASDDAEHTSRLDQLMMIQGWRRYKRVKQARYLPEVTTTFEGSVYKIPSSADMIELDDLNKMMNGSSEMARIEESLKHLKRGNEFTFDDSTPDDQDSQNGISENEVDLQEESTLDPVDDFYNGKPLKKEVLVEGEVSFDGKSYGVVAKTTDGGKFSFKIPPYYDNGILFIKAYNAKDSVKRSMEGLKDKKWMDERAYPDYYVKRDMFFPIFTYPYSWYQVNSPELLFVDEDDDGNIPSTSKLAGNHMLQTVIVKARRRGKRSWDMSKPAIVRDIYDLYNDVTDYGLSPGVLNFKKFPLQVTNYLFGNMGLMKQPNIRAIMEGRSFFRNYVYGTVEFDKNMATTYMFDRLRLSRMKDVRVYTDYELRTDSGYVAEETAAAVVLDFVPIENDGTRHSYRDRRYVFPGITYAEEFYSPDYSQYSNPSSQNSNPPKDYRRTLYWNPNAKPDADGKFTTTFYNNSRETRVRVSAVGVGGDGKMYFK